MNKKYITLHVKYQKEPKKRQVLICPYCNNETKPDNNTEYVKMKSGHETFFHRSCLYKSLQENVKH